MRQLDPGLRAVLQQKFFNDPSWRDIEDILREYIKELEDMSTLNENADAHNLKAEIKGRKKAKEALERFLQDTGIISISNTAGVSFK